MAEYYRRNSSLQNGNFVEGELELLKDEDPWEYMFDGPCPQNREPTDKELEILMAQDYVKSRATQKVMSDLIKHMWAVIRGKNVFKKGIQKTKR